jgi:hypothetical protein
MPGGGQGGATEEIESKEEERAKVTIQPKIETPIFEGELLSESEIVWLTDKSGFHIKGDGVNEDLAEALRCLGLLVSEISLFDLYVEPKEESETFEGDEREVYLTSQKHFGEEPVFVVLLLPGKTNEWKIILRNQPFKADN